MLLNNLKLWVLWIVLVLSSLCVRADQAGYLYDSVCPIGPDGVTPGGTVYGGRWNDTDKYFVDKWGFAQCNGTSYVAYRINLNGLSFNNTFRQPEGQRWSNGKDWDEAAERAGVPITTMYPAPGDVAQWNLGEIGGDFGHVAYVEKVNMNSDGTVKSIMVSQYNIVLNNYSEKELVPGTSGYPGRFLMFRLRREGTIAWFPPVNDCTQASQWFYVSADGTRLPGAVTKDQCPTSCQQ